MAQTKEHDHSLPPAELKSPDGTAIHRCKHSGIIKTKVPKRPEGQKDVVGLRVAPLDSVRVGFIGLGMRGPGAVRRFGLIDRTSVKALCDKYQDRVDKAQKKLTETGRPAATEYVGDEAWKELCRRPDIDLVYIATDWENHVPMAVYAMQQGKHVAVEVPAAMNLDECWQLINTAEETQRHCMMLENCVYDFFELTTLNMAQQGLFGDILHVEGSYIHNLEDFWKAYEGNWRLDFNEKHRGDVYATHGMGPAAQLVNLHRGNKMNYIVSMDTRPATGPKLVKNLLGRDSCDFKNGDHTMSMIQTENGQTMHIQHDVMNPRPYSRMYQVTGTEGFANKYMREGFAFRDAAKIEGVPDHEDLSSHDFVPDEVKEALMKQYKHPIVAEIEEEAKKVGGHGGMDYIMDYRLVYCLLNGLPLDQDVYDAAEWSSLGELSRISIENNSAPVEVPDFTRGNWKKLNGYHHYMKGE
ncbi:MAG: Gfo/Idh/MocA family oxidoreductase [Muribaculaceae bacterium]|nr:Gfo/Idh/MocA family oxidoreductase [Muribaculaceae bacterium]